MLDSPGTGAGDLDLNPQLSSEVNHLLSFTERVYKIGEQGGVGGSHGEAANPSPPQGSLTRKQGTCVIERDRRVFHSVNKTKPSFRTHQKYFL